MIRRSLLMLFAAFLVLGAGSASAENVSTILDNDRLVEILESKRVTEGSSELQMLAQHFRDPETGCEYVKISGDVPRNTAAVTSMIRKLPKCNGHKTVYLNNNGGYLSGAQKLADFFKRNKVHTVVGKNDGCFSACTLIFMGGRKRTLETESGLVFHAPYASVSKDDEEPHCNKRMVKWWREQIREMLGFSRNSTEIGKRAFSHCGFDGGWAPDIAEARELGLVTQ